MTIYVSSSVTYRIITNNDAVLVLIENIAFNPKEFGLRIPPNMNENKSINQIISEVINQYLKNKLLLAS